MGRQAGKPYLSSGTVKDIAEEAETLGVIQRTMQSCQNCGQKFSFTQIYKSFWYGYRTLVCGNCKTNYEHSFKNRWIGGVSVGLAVFFGGLVQSFAEFSTGYKLLVGALTVIFIGLLFSSICVSFLTFEKEEKRDKPHNRYGSSPS